MAKVVSTYTNSDGHEIAVYESGAERDTVTNRLVAPASHTVITTENSTAFHRVRQEQKRARLLAGAARTLERAGDWTTPDDLDVVEAIGEAVMMKALNPDNVKQVDAARFILQESGMSEQRGQTDDGGQAERAAAMNAATALLLERALAEIAKLQPPADVVEGKVNDGQLEG